MASHIYHGVWVNWSNGSAVTGATLTVSDRDGGLLTSFIATFVTFVGAQLWRILSFAIHQIRSTTKPEDGLHHQQQAVWRNASGPGGVAWIMLQQLWYWRHAARHSFLRTFTWALLATAYLILFAVLAIFSSQISKASGSMRLLVSNPDNCGFWLEDTASDIDTLYMALSSKKANVSARAATYARACYLSSSNPQQCGRYVVPSISWDFDANATCPFESGICGYGDTAAFQMTSKPIDSQQQLGINSRSNERIQLQLRTTCAPIRQANHYEEFNHTRYWDHNATYNDTYMRLQFGPIVNAGGFGLDIPYTAEAAYHGFLDSMGYSISGQIAYANGSNGTTGWNPIPALFRKDADVSLIFLKQNSVQYREPSWDPWLRATSQNIPNEINQTWYNSDLYVNTLGCAEQSRYCNPNNGRCTAYLGHDQLVHVFDNASDVGMSELQKGISSLLSFSMRYRSAQTFTESLGSSALRAQETIFAEMFQTAKLPGDQWHKEVSYWFSAGLATLQAQVLEFPRGPSSIIDGSQLVRAKNAKFGAYVQTLCSNQLINDGSDTMSFSILGMTILFALGGFIILTSFVIERIVAVLQQSFKFNLHGQRAWMLDDKLQMQKLVFE